MFSAVNNFTDKDGKVYNTMYLSEHTIIVGSVCTGKTTLLYELIRVLQITNEKVLFIDDLVDCIKPPYECFNVCDALSILSGKHCYDIVVIDNVLPKYLFTILPILFRQKLKSIITCTSNDIPFRDRFDCSYIIKCIRSRSFRIVVKNPYMIIVNENNIQALIRLQKFVRDIKWYKLFKLIRTREFSEWYYKPGNIGSIIWKQRILDCVSK